MYIEAFTNRTFFLTRAATFLPDDAAYVPGDELELCYAAKRPDLAELDEEEAAQVIFEELNHDGRRANAGLFPALSIGDVVSYRTDNKAGSLAVEVLGFRTVSPVFASSSDRARYGQKMRTHWGRK